METCRGFRRRFLPVLPRAPVISLFAVRHEPPEERVADRRAVADDREVSRARVNTLVRGIGEGRPRRGVRADEGETIASFSSPGKPSDASDLEERVGRRQARMSRATCAL